MISSSDIQLLNPLVNSSASGANNFEDDYGFIDLDEEIVHPEELESQDNATEHSENSGSLSGGASTFSFGQQSSSRVDGEVICEVHCARAPTTCRSFNMDDVLQTHVAVYLSIPKFRIVQTFGGEVAEYLVNVTVNGKEFSSWKRYENFKELADACREHSRMLELYDASIRCSKAPNSLPLESTLEAWWQVESHRPWLASPTQPSYLSQELVRIKKFMDTFLFEASNLKILCEFLRN